MASAAVAGAVAALLAPSLASASPSPLAKPAQPETAQSVQAKLKSLSKQNDLLVEKFNQAKIAVTKTQKAAALAQRDAATAQASFLSSQDAMSAAVAAQYEAGSFSTTGALLSSSSGQGYLEQLNTLDMISAHYALVVKNFDIQRTAADAATKRVAALLKTAQARLDALAKQKKDLDAKILAYRILLASLTVPERNAYESSIAPAMTPAQLNATLSSLSKLDISTRAKKAVDFALAQIGKPYSYGAAGPGSYDCSGLTMASWAQGGVSLPHSAQEQSYVGKRVPLDLKSLQPGDLLFYYQPYIGHVTIYVGNNLAVSAPQSGESVKLIPALGGYLQPWMATNPLG